MCSCPIRPAIGGACAADAARCALSTTPTRLRPGFRRGFHIDKRFRRWSDINRYEKLAGNTLIFAVGSFASKLMVFLLTPLYTRVLTPGDYGISDLITSTSNLIMPFMMLSINEAIIRFGMDRSVKKSEVFTVGLVTVFCGFVVFCLFAPVFYLFEKISAYTVLIYLYVLFAALKAVTAQFVRSAGLVRLYTFDGFLATFTTIVFNVLLLVVFKTGVVGYVLSVVLSNILSVLFLFAIARLSRYVKPRQLNRDLFREMVRYSIPLIPTTMFWWITNVSDRYLVTWFCGEAANGIYAAAYKIPAMLTLVSSIFYQAWQISAVTEYGQGARTSRFYTEIFGHYSSLLFLGASGILMLLRPLNFILMGEAFTESWRYVPYLVLAEVFSSLVTFLGSFYMVSKKNATVVLAIAAGGISNIAMNCFLIPVYGPMGAAFATFVSYLLAFIVRALDVRRLVTMKFGLLSIAVNFFVVMLQTAAALSDLKYAFAAQAGLFLVMAAINHKTILRLGLAVLHKLVPRLSGPRAE